MFLKYIHLLGTKQGQCKHIYGLEAVFLKNPELVQDLHDLKLLL